MARPQAEGGTTKIKVNPTQLSEQMDLPVESYITLSLFFGNNYNLALGILGKILPKGPQNCPRAVECTGFGFQQRLILRNTEQILAGLRYFCVSCALGIGAIYFLMITWFVAWMTIDQGGDSIEKF